MTRILASALRSRTTRQRDDARERCIASGWQLRRSCTDGHGHAVCPACTRPVRMRSPRALSQRAWVVEEHLAA